MPEWSDGYIHAGDLKIHYYRMGGDRSPEGRLSVIMNHGAGDDGLCWLPTARALEGAYDVILPDARGHGKSGSGRGDYSTAQRVADLAYLVEALKLDRPVVGGHSLGAGTAVHFAARHPELTRGIFLEDPPVTLPGERLTRAGKEVDQEDMGKKMVAAMRLFKILPRWVTIPMLKKIQPAYPEDEIGPIAAAQKRVSFDFIQQMPGLSKAITDRVEIFEKIAVPVLLIIGDKENMTFVSQEGARLAARLNPGVEVVHLAGASHNIRRDRFDGYMAALKAFLQKMDC